jgi:hypothetical protein
VSQHKQTEQPERGPCGYLFPSTPLILLHSQKLMQNLLVSLAIHDSNHPKAKGHKKRGLNNMLFLQQISELSHIRLMVFSTYNKLKKGRRTECSFGWGNATDKWP